MDKDKSGTVNALELLTALREMEADIDLESVKKFIAQNDANGDGCLDKAEMIGFFRSMLG